MEKYKSYSKCKDKVRDDLNNLGKMLGQSLSQIPMSYKEALENLQECKVREDLKNLKNSCKTVMHLCRAYDIRVVRNAVILYLCIY